MLSRTHLSIRLLADKMKHGPTTNLQHNNALLILQVCKSKYISVSRRLSLKTYKVCSFSKGNLVLVQRDIQESHKNAYKIG